MYVYIYIHIATDGWMDGYQLRIESASGPARLLPLLPARGCRRGGSLWSALQQGVTTNTTWRNRGFTSEKCWFTLG